MLKRQHDGYTWVFVTNTSSWAGSRFPSKIAAMMKTAMSRVKQWPQRDLFAVESHAHALEQSWLGGAKDTTSSWMHYTLPSVCSK